MRDTLGKRRAGMKRALMLAAAIVVAMPALAALPPEYQRAAELKAVIAAATEVLEPIDGVVFVVWDVYEARSGHCAVVVTIADVPLEEGREPVMGPRRFKAVAQAPICD